jgi:hypothetical protein
MAESYCLRLVAPVPQARLEDVARAVALEIGGDRETLSEALAQPAGALIIRSGSLEAVTEAMLVLRRHEVHTESERVHRPREPGHTTQTEGSTGRQSSAPGGSPHQSGFTIQAVEPTREPTDLPDAPSRIPEWSSTGRGHEVSGSQKNRAGNSGVGCTVAAILVLVMITAVLNETGLGTGGGTSSGATSNVEKLDNRAKGFHCLSGWDGAHPEFARAVRELLRDPRSFEHIETRISPVNANGEHTILMEFRANNAFGGKVVSVARGIVSNATCNATVISID